MSPPPTFDFVIVGSGASAVHAAWPLVEAGRRVAMLDVGIGPDPEAALPPRGDFVLLRRTDDEQHRYFLGDDFEGLSFGPVGVGAQLTPPRQFVFRDAERLAPIDAGRFRALQSLALGGLAAAWGASTMPFTDNDLRGWPLTRADLQPHYDAVAERIGVCGPALDDLTPFVGRIAPLMPPVGHDSNAEELFGAYRRRRGWFQQQGLFVGHPRLAVATVPFRGRGPVRYDDMEFWHDHSRAVWRATMDAEALARRPNCRLIRGVQAMGFERDGADWVVCARDVATNERLAFAAPRVVLAAGTLGTARLVLRSLGRYDEPVPLVANPYTYLPCLVWRRLGRPTRDRRHSLTQLTMIYDPGRLGAHVVQPQVYSYRSLLLHRLVKESPLSVRESIPLLRLLEDYFVVVGVFHPDRPGGSKSMCLRRGDTAEFDTLEIRYAPTSDERRVQRRTEKSLGGLLRRLSCLPLKRIAPGDGASIHYAGALPMTRRGEADSLTTTLAGELRAAPGVFIADGATFPDLPAKGLTFTLMANAHRIGTALSRQ